MTVALIDDAKTITAEGSHTCGTQHYGNIFCWGANTRGKLGIDAEHHSALPQEVVREYIDINDPDSPNVPDIGVEHPIEGLIPRGPADDQIRRLYRAAFGRYPEQSGFNYWTELYRGGKSLESISAFFVSSPERQRLYGPDPTDAVLIAAMYQNVHGRPGELEGVVYWKGRVDDGLSRPHLLMSFADSPENIDLTNTRQAIDSRQSQILRIYNAVFDRSPDTEGFGYWTNRYRTGTWFLPELSPSRRSAPLGPTGRVHHSQFRIADWLDCRWLRPEVHHALCRQQCVEPDPSIARRSVLTPLWLDTVGRRVRYLSRRPSRTKVGLVP